MAMDAIAVGLFNQLFTFIHSQKRAKAAKSPDFANSF